MSRFFGGAKANASATKLAVSTKDLSKVLFDNRESVIALDMQKVLKDINQPARYILAIKTGNGEIYDAKIFQQLFAAVLRGESELTLYKQTCSDYDNFYTVSDSCEQIRTIDLDLHPVYLEAISLPKFEKPETVLDIDSWQIYATQMYSKLLTEIEIPNYRNAFYNIVPKMKSSMFYAGFVNLDPIEEDYIELNSFGNKLYIRLLGEQFEVVTRRCYLPFKTSDEYHKFKELYVMFKQKYPYVSAKILWYFKDIDFDRKRIVLKPRKLIVQYGINKKRARLPKFLTAEKLMQIIYAQKKFIERKLTPNRITYLKEPLIRFPKHLQFIYKLYSSYNLQEVGLNVAQKYAASFRNKIEKHLEIPSLETKAIEVLTYLHESLSDLETSFIARDANRLMHRLQIIQDGLQEILASASS